MTYRSLRPFKVMVKEGLQVSVRDVIPDDSRLIELGFDRLSKQSRISRFMGAKQHLTSREVDQFSALNTVDHVAVGALSVYKNEAEPVAIARYIRTDPKSSVAEIAVTVVDRFQNHGIGTLLLGVLAKNAHANGITEFFAFVARGNSAIRHILRELGGTEELSDEPEVSIALQIRHDPMNYPDNKVGACFREAYLRAEFSAD